MGDWGHRPWETDEAADWFHTFWKKGFPFLIEELDNFDEREERYESIRAACYILQTLGSPYMWPTEHLDRLQDLLDSGIKILENLINPPNKNWGFMDMWGEDKEVMDSVRNQIKALQKMRSEIPTN